MFTFNASKLRVNGKAGRAEFTEWLVVLHVAWRVAGADVRGAGVHALVGHARLRGAASLVTETDGDRGVAVLHADAHGLMVEHITLLGGRAGLAYRAWVHTLVVDARQVARALVVRPALYGPCRTDKLAH